MARSVGNIEVTVDADTGRLKAQIVKASKEAGEAGGEAIEEGLSDVDGRELLARIRKIKADIQRAMAGIEADIDLEADVTRDLARIQEQVRQAQIELILTPEVQDRDLQALLTEVRVKLTNAIEAEVGLELDENEAREVILEAQAALSLADTEIQAQMSLAGEEAFKADLRRALFEAEAEAESINVEWELEMRTALAEAQLIALREKEERDHLELHARLDTATAATDLELFILNAERQRIEVQLQPELDQIAATKAQAQLLATFRDIHPDVEPEFDFGGTAAALAERQLAQWATSAGSSAGGKGGSAFGSAFKGGALSSLGDQGFWIGIGLTLAQPLAVGMEGIISAGVATLSSGLSAIGGAVGGATPLLFGGAAAFTAVAIGVEGVGEALKHVKEENWEALKDALEDLSPAARDFVAAFAEIQPTIQTVRQEVQQALFEGLGGELRTLADETIPDVGAALVIAAGSVNEFAREMAAVARQTEFTETMEAIDPALDNAFDAAVLLAGTLEPFLMAAAPAAEELTGWLEEGAAALKDWVIENDDEIERFLLDGVASLEAWGSLLFSVGDLLATVFGDGVDEGDRFVRKLDAIVTRWDQWLEGPTGQTALETFFTEGEQAMQDMKPLLEGLATAWGILTEGEAGENFADLMTEAGEAAPAFAEFLQALGEMELGTGILNIIDTLGIIGEIFSLLPDDVEKFVGQLLVVTKVLGPLNRALSTMGKSFGWLALLNIAVAAGVAIFDAITGGADTAALSTKHVGDEWASLNQQLLEGQQVGNTTAEMWKNLAEAVPEVENYDRLTAAMEKLGITTDDFVKVIPGLREEGEAAIPALEKIAEEAGLAEDSIGGLAEIVSKVDTDDPFGKMGEQLETAIRDIETTTGQAVPNTVDSFEELADATGIPMERLLEFGGVSDEISDDMAELAESTGKPVAELLEQASALEQLQDSAEDIDIDKIAEEELRLAAVSNDVTQGILEQAAANLAASGSYDNMDDSIANILAKGEDLVPLYQEYVRVSNEVARAQQEGAGAAAAESSAMQLLSNAYTQAGIAAQEREEALREEQAAALRAWQEEQRVGEEVARTAAAVAAADFGIPVEFAEGVVALGKAWETATTNADAFLDVMEVMRGGLPDLEEQIANTETAFRELEAGVTDTNEAGEEFTVPPAFKEIRTSAGELISIFDLATESGAAYAEANRSAAEEALALAAAQLQAGESGDVIIGQLDDYRDRIMNEMIPALEAQGSTHGQATALAAEYANTLLGTPEVLETAVRVPGLLEALLNAEELTVLYDSAGNPVVTEFEALGAELTAEETQGLIDMFAEMDGRIVTVDVGADGIQGTADDIRSVQEPVDTLDGTTAEPNVQLAGHVVMIALLAAEQTMLTTLNNTVADPTLKLSDYPTVTANIITLGVLLAALDGMTADPDVDLHDYELVRGQLANLAIAVANLSFMVASPDVRLDNYQTVMNQIDNIQANIDSLHGRTVTVTTVHSTIGAPGMSGDIVGSPEVRLLGERNYREAIIPLDLPLNRVSPEVREMAAMLRGNTAAPTLGPAVRQGSPINQYFTLTSSDPGAVAVQAMNRAAAMAG